MSVGSSLNKSSGSKSVLSVQTIVLAQVGWAVLALLFFLLFSVPAPGQPRPYWYSVGTSIFETVAFITAAILCFRNWQSPQIVSGRNVWLCIGLGMLCYFIGNLLFSYWELGLGIEPDVSPGDFFFVFAYIFLLLGMLLAVISRRLNLEIWQWGVVGVIAALGIILAYLASAPATSSTARSPFLPPAIAQTAPAKPAQKTKASPQANPTAQPKSPTATSPAPTTTDKTLPAPAIPAEKASSPKTEDNSNVPAWAQTLEKILAPLKPFLDWFYVISDILLLIIATTLLLAFWGGRFAQSWRMIAAAAFSLYIADIWFKYATNRLSDYQSGGLLEVFWVFSGVLFGIGAALEYDVSSRSRSRTGGRRRVT
ncbi:MAG: hypothetical protein K6T90_01825 [Leptolyngbyaceae cyanobacterium HOT.MB2.61]|nr:hypothetical protein [Leptolyngbyaceae cyanobacterium HOT.MB2.61]